ncbi:MAG: universal stress protein [Bradymonadales bacterium]|nr:universal stress protein [Bradymonadales bacterium]
MKTEHILLATDLSAAARQAYPHAAGLAKATGARITLFHVDETAYYSFRSSAEVLQYFERVAGQIRERLAEDEEFLSEYEIEVTSATATGAASQAILQFVADNDVDLVVMSKHGLRGGKRLLLGSTSKRLVRHVTCPVLLVPARETDVPQEPTAYQKFLTTTDFSEDSIRGLHACLDLAERCDAQVELLHVLEFPTLVPLLPGEPPLYIPKESVDELREFHESRLHRLTQSLDADRLTAWTTIGSDVADTITDAAMGSNVDLIAISSHGHGAVRSVLFGSTSEHVIKLAQKPVLVFTREYLKNNYAHVTITQDEE